MSAHVLAGFIRDVSAINPAFRASTSSLRLLIRRLRATTRTPMPMTADQAVGLRLSASWAAVFAGFLDKIDAGIISMT